MGQNQLNQCANGVRIHQRTAILSIHHRIDDHMLRLILVQLSSNRFHARRRGQHANLDRIRDNILKHCVNLLFNHFRRNILNVDDARGVFRHNRNDDAHTEHAVRRHGFQIRLYTSAARTIRTGNGQYLFDHMISSSH